MTNNPDSRWLRTSVFLACFLILVVFTGWRTRPHWWLEKLNARVTFGSNEVSDARVYFSAKGDILLLSGGSMFVVKADSVFQVSRGAFVCFPGIAYSKYLHYVAGVDLRSPKIDGTDPHLLRGERHAEFAGWKISW